MVTLEALARKKAMFYVPAAYKEKYSETIGADALKNIKKLHFEMIEPPIVRRTPLPEDRQPTNEDGSRKTHEDGTLVVYHQETAYIPIRIDGEDKILITSSRDMLTQFYGIAYDELDDPEQDGAILRFYQDKIDGGLTLKWKENEIRSGERRGQTFYTPLLESD